MKQDKPKQMMKHLKRKMLKEHQINYDQFYKDDPEEAKKPPAPRPLRDKHYLESNIMIFTDRIPGIKIGIQGFTYKIKDKWHYVPEPNPAVIYFSVAQQFSGEAKAAKERFIKAMTEHKGLEEQRDALYSFHGNASICVTNLFNSVEVFINLKIPPKFIYQRMKKGKPDIYDHWRIQREMSFEDKIKKILPNPKVTGKNYGQQNPNAWQQLKAIKKFRDDIQHTKTVASNGVMVFSALFRRALDFDYTNAIWTVKDFFDFYEPGLIEECNCGKPEPF